MRAVLSREGMKEPVHNPVLKFSPHKTVTIVSCWVGFIHWHSRQRPGVEMFTWQEELLHFIILFNHYSDYSL